MPASSRQPRKRRQQRLSVRQTEPSCRSRRALGTRDHRSPGEAVLRMAEHGMIAHDCRQPTSDHGSWHFSTSTCNSTPKSWRWLVVDIDRTDAYFAEDDADLPPFSVIMRNRIMVIVTPMLFSWATTEAQLKDVFSSSRIVFFNFVQWMLLSGGRQGDRWVCAETPELDVGPCRGTVGRVWRVSLRSHAAVPLDSRCQLTVPQACPLSLDRSSPRRADAEPLSSDRSRRRAPAATRWVRPRSSHP